MGIEDDGFSAAFDAVAVGDPVVTEDDPVLEDIPNEIDAIAGEIQGNSQGEVEGEIQGDDDQSTVIPEPQGTSENTVIPEPKESPVVPETLDEPAEIPAHLPEVAYSEEEQEFLKTYSDEWAEVSKGEALKRRHEYTAIVNYVMEQMAQQVAPLQKAVEKYESVLKKQEILKSHDDYDSIQPKLMQWADKQPSYLRDAYKNVITRGNIEDVNDLIARFKQETAPPSQAKPEELSPRTDKAVQKLAIVNSRRSGPTQVDDPMDFEAAFEKASKLAR